MSRANMEPPGMPRWLFDGCLKVAKGRPMFTWSGWSYWLFGVVRQWGGGWWLQLGPLGIRLRAPQAEQEG